MTPERRQEIFRLMVHEERDFVLRIGWCLALAALGCGLYFFYSSSRYEADSIRALDSDGDMDVKASFEILKDLNFFSGISRPEPLIPQGDPVLDGLSSEAIMEVFVKGTAFIGSQGALNQSMKSLVARADAGNLDEDSLATAEKIGTDFRHYLELRTRAFDPTLLSGERIAACQRFAPCVSGVLQRRFPTAYNAMVLLYRYAHSKEYTERTVSYAKGNLGHFVVVREKAFGMGFPALKADRKILGFLREVQVASLHNTLVSTVFLIVMSLLFLGSAYRSRLWTDALERGWVGEDG